MANIIVFDTDILIDYLIGMDEAAHFLFSFKDKERFVTSISVMEVYRSARNMKELEVFQRFFRRNFQQILHLDEGASKLGLKLVEAYTLSHGLSIPDALIAAVTLVNNAKLSTGNLRHFKFIEGLKVALPPYRD
jgi:predicted nucleic acid-binding protein